MSVASDYKKRLYKEVTLPSGFTFKIKAIGPFLVTRLMNKHNLTIDEIRRGSNIFNAELLCTAVVEPKLSMEPSDDENTLCVEDILNEDLTRLLSEVIAFSGLREENNPLQK